MPENREHDDAGLTQSDYVKAALKWQYNLIGLGGALAFAVVSGTGLPLLLAAGLELMYVATVPQNSRFRRLVRSWKYAEEKRQKEMKLFDLFKELPPELKSRYEQVVQVARAIRANYAKLSTTSQMFVQQMDQKLTGLQHGYVRLLHASYTHRDYLQSLNTASVKRELEGLEKSQSSASAKVQEINAKRIEILRKRLEKFEKIRENNDVITAQCSAIEDVLQLIRDQSVTMRDPQEVSAQLDTLVQDVEQTEQNVREIEAIFALASPESTEVGAGESAVRNRIRS